MNIDNRLGTIDDVLGSVDESLTQIVHRLRQLIIDVDPDTTEQPRPGDRALSYGVGPRKMLDGYAYIMPQKSYVNLGFYRGAHLPDPMRLLEGTGKDLRHVKVRSLADVDREGMRDLIAAAVSEKKSGTER